MHQLQYCVYCGLSVERFQRYARDGEELAAPLARYLWNIRLSEALYPTMNCVEIGMRNSIHRAFTAEYGPLWFDVPGLLEPKEIASVDAAKTTLVKKQKPLTPEGIVAELSFGFWTTLMSSKHHNHTPSVEEYLKPWPRLLKAAFPHVPKRERRRSNISAPLNKIRTLRNRVSHHEPIWHQGELLSTYLEATKLCEWLSPGMAEAIATIDRFRDVYDLGSVVHQDAVEHLAGWKPPAS